ncbi:MAG: LacI family DNA-binding transcriptional regulator [Armatimonadota bacterium]
MIHRNRVTIIDVARLAGVSKSTVANVLNSPLGVPIQDVTRKRVLEAVAELGYQKNALAAAFSSGRTNTIGILLPQHHQEATSRVYRQFGQELFTAVFDAACEADLRVTSIPNWERDASIEALNDRRVDGLILASIRSRETVAAIYASGIPCVEISSGFGDHLVHPDNEGGIRQAIEHLVGLGHRRIAYYRGPLGDYFASERRYNGFVDACQTYRLSPDECPVLLARVEVTAQLELPLGQRPTAVLTFNDSQASIVYDMAQALGLSVPDDLSVVGFDNSLIAELIRPGLTTIDNALADQARGAVARLMTLWKRDFAGLPVSEAGDQNTMTPLRIPTRLVVRQSTGRVPKGV